MDLGVDTPSDRVKDLLPSLVIELEGGLGRNGWKIYLKSAD